MLADGRKATPAGVMVIDRIETTKGPGPRPDVADALSAAILPLIVDSSVRDTNDLNMSSIIPEKAHKTVEPNGRKKAAPAVGVRTRPPDPAGLTVTASGSALTLVAGPMLYVQEWAKRVVARSTREGPVTKLPPTRTKITPELRTKINVVTVGVVVI